MDMLRKKINKKTLEFVLQMSTSALQDSALLIPLIHNSCLQMNFKYH